MQPTLSIIVPAYNAQAYIFDSLYSLLQQATKEVEVIVVNDGSTDNTVEIINRKFKEKLNVKQLVLCTQDNHGVSAARNLGIENARGEYVGFMDADDLVLSGYVETLLNAIELNPHIIEFGFKRFTFPTDEFEQKLSIYSNKCFGRHNISKVIDRVYSTAKWYPWTRVFKKELFQDIHFPEDVRFCEDLMTVPYLYEQAQTIVVLEDAIYGYRSNEHSATFLIKNDYVENLVKFYQRVPRGDIVRYKYFRLSIAFAIMSCQSKLDEELTLPNFIKEDLVNLRSFWPAYFNISPRVIAVLFYPSQYKFIRRLFRSLTGGRA